MPSEVIGVHKMLFFGGVTMAIFHHFIKHGFFQSFSKSLLDQQNIISSKYTEFVEGNFEGKAEILREKYGDFDFVFFWELFCLDKFLKCH